MTPREVLFLISQTGEVLWRDVGESPLALPDTRTRWEALWHHREALAIVAHSHPLGPASFSEEDESTMRAVEEALGRTLTWVVVAPVALVQRGPVTVDARAGWVSELKTLSHMT